MKPALQILLSVFRLFLIITLGMLMMRQTFAFQSQSEAVLANTPPTIAAVAPLPLRAGSKKAGLVIAAVKDRESPLGELKVTAAALAGITISNIKNTDGIITADFEIDCSVLPSEKSIRLTVSDGLLTGNTFLTVIISDLASVNLGQFSNATIKGTVPYTMTPTGLSIDPEANVILTVEAKPLSDVTIDQSTGSISFPAGISTGSYLVVIRATNNCGIVASRSFTLSVTNPPVCNAMTFASQPNIATSDAPTSMAVGDFNGDEKPDLVVANYEANTISIFLNDGTGQWSPKKDYQVGQNPKFIAVADFNNDGIADLAIANSSGGTLSILVGKGDGTFVAKPDVTGMNYPSSIAFGDFNQDHKIDLVVTNSGSYVTSVLYGNNDGTFGAPADYYQGSLPIAVAVGDFDKDGLDDFAVANNISNTVTVFRNFGANYFFPYTINLGTSPSALLAGDFNADGWVDLIAANYESDSISVLSNNHSGGFLAPESLPVPKNPIALATADFNNDGSQDLAVLSVSANSLLLLTTEINNSSVHFAKQQQLNVGEAYALALADFNNDSQIDFSLSSYWTNELLSATGTCVEAPTNATFRSVIFRQREKTARVNNVSRAVIK